MARQRCRIRRGRASAGRPDSRPARGACRRCGVCQRRCVRYDAAYGRPPSAVTQLMRIAWRTAGSIIAGTRPCGSTRFLASEAPRQLTWSSNPSACGWCGPRRDMSTVQTSLDLLGPERCGRITNVSAEGPRSSRRRGQERCGAVCFADPFVSCGRHTRPWTRCVAGPGTTPAGRLDHRAETSIGVWSRSRAWVVG